MRTSHARSLIALYPTHPSYSRSSVESPCIWPFWLWKPLFIARILVQNNVLADCWVDSRRDVEANWLVSFEELWAFIRSRLESLWIWWRMESILETPSWEDSKLYVSHVNHNHSKFGAISASVLCGVSSPPVLWSSFSVDRIERLLTSWKEVFPDASQILRLLRSWSSTITFANLFSKARLRTGPPASWPKLGFQWSQEPRVGLAEMYWAGSSWAALALFRSWPIQPRRGCQRMGYFDFQLMKGRKWRRMPGMLQGNTPNVSSGSWW